MQLTLNLKRSSFLMIGQYHFSAENPGPVTINEEELSFDQKMQILHNLQKETLIPDDAAVTHRLSEEVQSHLPDPNRAPLPLPGSGQEEDVDPLLQNFFHTFTGFRGDTIENALDNKKSELKQVLLNNIPTVLKEATQMKIADLRKLLTLEKEQQNSFDNGRTKDNSSF